MGVGVCMRGGVIATTCLLACWSDMVANDSVDDWAIGDVVMSMHARG